MEAYSLTLSPRNVRALLDETFSVYSKHLWCFLKIAAMVQIPISVISYTVFYIWGLGAITFLSTILLSIFGGTFAYSAVVFAVGQQYLTGDIDVRRCYERTFWRIRSLAIVTFVMGFVVLSGPIAVFSGWDTLTVVGVILLFPSVVVSIYLSLAIQVVVIEGCRAQSALSRSFMLVQGNWWRILGLTLVFGLVVFGLSIFLSIPLAVISLVAESVEVVDISGFTKLAGDLIIPVIVPPVLFISGTLIYYDVRLKKEGYDFRSLSVEMGVLPVCPVTSTN